MNKNFQNISTQAIKLFGWIGTILLLLIIPIKLFRVLENNQATILFIGIIPSVLGTFGLLFLVLSDVKRLSKLTLIQKILFVGCIALGLEFSQLLPRPGLFRHIHYTFDWLDVIASLVSLVIAYFIARFIILKYK